MFRYLFLFSVVSLFAYSPPNYVIDFVEKKIFGMSNGAAFQIDPSYSPVYLTWQSGDVVELNDQNIGLSRFHVEIFGGQVVLVNPVIFKNLTRQTSVLAYQERQGILQTPGTRQIVGIFTTIMNLDDATQWGIVPDSQIITNSWSVNDLILMGSDPLTRQPIALNITRGTVALLTEL